MGSTQKLTYLTKDVSVVTEFWTQYLWCRGYYVTKVVGLLEYCDVRKYSFDRDNAMRLHEKMVQNIKVELFASMKDWGQYGF